MRGQVLRAEGVYPIAGPGIGRAAGASTASPYIGTNRPTSTRPASPLRPSITPGLARTWKTGPAGEGKPRRLVPQDNVVRKLLVEFFI